MEEMKTKKCSKCKRELPITEFHRNKAAKDGLQSHCKECTKLYDANKKKTICVQCLQIPNLLNSNRESCLLN